MARDYVRSARSSSNVRIVDFVRYLRWRHADAFGWRSRPIYGHCRDLRDPGAHTGTASPGPAAAQAPQDKLGQLTMDGSGVSRAVLLGPLRSRNFRLLAACNIISVAGSAVSFVAIPFAVLRIGGTASDIGYVATAELIPLIAFLLLGGVIADWLPRHQVIVAANALQAFAQGTSAVLGPHRPRPRLAARSPGRGRRRRHRLLLPCGPGPAPADSASRPAAAGQCTGPDRAQRRRDWRRGTRRAPRRPRRTWLGLGDRRRELRRRR